MNYVYKIRTWDHPILWVFIEICWQMSNSRAMPTVKYFVRYTIFVWIWEHTKNTYFIEGIMVFDINYKCV